MIDAIQDFPTPTNITGIRSWFGFVNQVAYAIAQAGVMAPFRDLLSTTNRQFYWDQTLDDLFTQSKEIIVNKIIAGVKSFEIDRPTLSCDRLEQDRYRLLFTTKTLFVSHLKMVPIAEKWTLADNLSRFTFHQRGRI